MQPLRAHRISALLLPVWWRAPSVRDQPGQNCAGRPDCQFADAEAGDHHPRRRQPMKIGIFRRMPLRRKLISIMLLTSGVSLLMITAALILHEEIRFRDNAVTQLA